MELEITTLYSVYDIKAKLWSTPITFDSDEAMEQYLSVLVNTHGNGHYHLYPEDFVVYKLGYWNEETGEFLPVDKQVALNVVGIKRPCKYCEKPEDIANESVKVQQRGASQSTEK